MTKTLTVSETADFLRVSKSTVRRKAMDGTLPALRIGSQLRFSREALERMLEGGNVAQHGEESCTTGYTNEQIAHTGGRAGQKTGGQFARARESGSRTTQEARRPNEPGQAYSLASINILLSGIDG